MLKSRKNLKKVSGETKKVLDKAKPLSYNNKAAAEKGERREYLEN